MDQIVKRFLRYLYLVTKKNKLSHEQVEQQLELLELDENLAHTSLIKKIAQTKAQLHQRENDLVCSVVEQILPVKAFYIHWVVSEIIENAFKFSEPGTPIIVQGEVENGEFCLSIRDNGRGMTATQIQGIDAFVQFERSKYEQQGMGLGLKIAQLAMKNINGVLSMSSAYQKNTKVDLRIPLFLGNL
jgi:K+-sensing histidine kinase KdpD